MHWHSLAWSSCVGPLSQTQHGLSPEADGFFIRQMEILWGHYACKLQPLCRELCVYWHLKLQWTCHHSLVDIVHDRTSFLIAIGRIAMNLPSACREAVNCALSSSSGYLLARKIKASDMSKTPRVECIVNSEICPGKADYLDKWVFNPDCFPCECARKSAAVVQIQTVLECWRLELEWVRMF